MKVGEVFSRFRFPSIFMIKSMIPYTVIIINELLKNGRVFSNIIPNTKESSFCLILVQSFQHKFRDVRNGAVIKSQVNHFFMGGYVPKVVWENSL